MTRGKLGTAHGIAIGTLVTIIVTIAAWLPGCGVKSAPIPPEFGVPERILDLRAESAVGGVKLMWTRPGHYVGGATMHDLSGFVVKRADGEGPMTALVEIPVTDRERFQLEENFSYLDGETQIGGRYRYTVTSEAAGYHGEASNEVEIARIKPPSPPNPDMYKLPAPSASPADTP